MRPEARLILVVAVALASCNRESLFDLDQPVAAEAAAGSASETPVTRSGIHGRVQAQDGSPVSGAVIQVECAAEPCRPIPEIGVLSNTDGVFFWPLQEGSYRLTARKDDLTSCPVTAEVGPSKDDPITLTLSLNTTTGCPL
ncbi:MAG: carboxypeptidase regulatory-like domain-containing protein [Pseudonocardiaceae bacterium]